MSSSWLSICVPTLLLLTCKTVHDRPTSGGTSPTPEGVDIVIEENYDVRTNTPKFLGKKVLVRGVIEEFVESDTIRLDYDGAIGFSSILVLLPIGPRDPSIKAGDHVEVIGVMKMFEVKEVRRDDDKPLPRFYVEWQRRPVVAAEHIKETGGS